MKNKGTKFHKYPYIYIKLLNEMVFLNRVLSGCRAGLEALADPVGLRVLLFLMSKNDLWGFDTVH
jgi:hypothetical protein